ncbi:hypothetical protein [Actinomadura bangladeshensis]|nr:hypothetical protein [Actinomadura bangladeshensis]
MTTLPRELIDVPERVHAGCLVLKLTAGIADLDHAARVLTEPNRFSQ